MIENNIKKLLIGLLIPVLMLTTVGCSDELTSEEQQNEQIQVEEQANNQDQQNEQQNNNQESHHKKPVKKPKQNKKKKTDLTKIKFKGEPYVTVNNNKPTFTKSELNAQNGHEHYPNLDYLGRCGKTFAKVGPETMPTETRKGIGMVKPAGWHTVRYDNLISDKYLYNRCHLIGFQLAGENANEKNLITGTRYLNVEGMLPFENQVADYVNDTGNHVLYKVEPIYRGDNLLAHGVKMQARSVEDKGRGVSFNVFCFNVQPGVVIDYATGDSHEGGYKAQQNNNSSSSNSQKGKDYNLKQKFVINTNTGKYHYPDCSSVKRMKSHNKKVMKTTKKYLESQGYEPCGNCQK